MKALKGILLGALAIALLTALWLKSNAVRYAEHVQFERGLRRLKQIDTAFNEDVLKVRSRLLVNFDGFVEQIQESKAVLAGLNNIPAFLRGEERAALERALRAYAIVLEEKHELVESFKSEAAILRNSQAYFPLAGRELVEHAEAAGNHALASDLSRLTRESLVFSLTSNEDFAPAVRAAIAPVRAWVASHPEHADTPQAASLVAHANVLLKRLPRVEAQTRRLVSAPSAEHADAAINIYESLFAEAQEATRHYRLALFGCSLVLMAGIAWAFRQLRAANQFLERRVEARTQELARNNAALEQEIAERRRTEEERDLLFTLSPDLLCIARIEGSFKRVNPAWSQALGWSTEELLARPYMELVHPEDRAVSEEQRQRLAIGQAVREFENRCVCKDGSHRWVSWTAAPAADSGLFYSYGRDITEKKLAEEERQQMEVQLRHAQKMESIGQLAAGIAHEINTPTQYIGDNNRFVRDAFNDLAPLLNAQTRLLAAAQAGPVPTELLAEVQAAAKTADVDYLTKEVPKAIVQALDGVERVSKIVRAMKEFSHPGSVEKARVDLNQAIESTLTVASNEWKYVAELVTDFDPALPQVFCLPGEFNQVVLNIVVNASHAIADVVGDGGKGKGRLTVTTRCDGNWAEVRIQDSGTGIPESARAKVFDPFFTTKGVGKGTGQGLAIAHSVIVDKHGGTIAFETETGKGTTFIIRIPINPAAGSAEERRKAA